MQQSENCSSQPLVDVLVKGRSAAENVNTLNMCVPLDKTAEGLYVFLSENTAKNCCHNITVIKKVCLNFKCLDTVTKKWVITDL
jgi:hypothetical protein